MADTAQTLYRLQLLDTELSEQQSKLREAKGSLGESAELLAARRTRAQASEELATWRARLRDLELDLQGLNDKIAKTERRLYNGRVTSPKELEALQQDYESLKRSRERLEDEVLLAMTRFDEWEKAVADATAQLTEVESKWRAEQDRLAREIEQLQDRIETLNKERATLTALLAADELALYEDLMRKKGGRAVALLVGQICQGCRVTVPTSKAQLVRRGQGLVICNNCGRILVSGK